MPSYPVVQLDVFTDRALAGNPLAVFPEPGGLEPDVMQALAREMNLSETTFVLPSAAADRHIRFFTPEAEIPLAGHPTIGTWWHLAQTGSIDVPADGTIDVTQETGAGVLPVRIEMEGGAPRRVVMTQASPAFLGDLGDPATLGIALGGTAETVGTPAPEVVSTALPQAMIPIVSRDVLRALPVGGRGGDLARRLAEHGTDCAMCFALDSVGTGAPVHCRMFAPGLGVPEDPATGSAAGALGAYLVHHGLVEPDGREVHIAIDQGLEIGRPSRIDVFVTVDDGGTIDAVRVGGTAVTVMQGEVTL
jgi:trans-2,3-dihydro-3-hydroxyanthranilate isomerase